MAITLNDLPENPWRRPTSEPLPSPIESFDARDWAASFVAHVERNPSIPTDVGTMTTWFANALVRGYDERRAWEKRNAAAHQAALVHDTRSVEARFGQPLTFGPFTPG